MRIGRKVNVCVLLFAVRVWRGVSYWVKPQMFIKTRGVRVWLQQPKETTPSANRVLPNSTMWLIISCYNEPWTLVNNNVSDGIQTMADGPVDTCFGSDIHTMAISWICEGWHAKYRKHKVQLTTNEHEIVWPIAPRLAKAINFQQYQSPGLSSTMQAELWPALSQSYELQLRHGSEVNSQPLIGNGGLGPAQCPQRSTSQAQQTETQKQVLNVYCSPP